MVAALVVGLLITLACALVWSATNGESLQQAISLLTDSARSGRSLISYGYEFLVAGLASYSAAAVMLGLAARLFHRPLRSFLTAAPRFRWREAVAGFGLAFPLVAVAFAAERLGDPTPFAPPILAPATACSQVLAYTAAAIVCLYLAAFAEEAIFRGWLLQQSSTWTRSIPLMLGLNGLLFSLAHFDPDPGNFLIRAFMGAGWAWIALRTAGVEFTTGAHLANNLFLALFVAPVKFVAAPHQPSGYGAAIIEALTLLILVTLVERRQRRTPPSAVAEFQSRP
jgi:membrane protease YdiL (CAAX protease family)